MKQHPRFQKQSPHFLAESKARLLSVKGRRNFNRRTFGIEVLEARIAPAAVISVAGGDLTVFDGTGVNDNITVSKTASDYHFFDPSGLTADTVSGAVQLDPFTVEVPDGLVFGTVSILTGAGADIVVFSGPFSTPTILTVDAGTGNDTIDVSGPLTPGGPANFQSGGAIIFNDSVTMAANSTLSVNAAGTINLPSSSSDLAATGSGQIHLTTLRDIVLGSGASITITDGDLTLSANDQTVSSTGSFVGITVDGALIGSSGSGTVTIAGTGGN